MFISFSVSNRLEHLAVLFLVVGTNSTKFHALASLFDVFYECVTRTPTAGCPEFWNGFACFLDRPIGICFCGYRWFCGKIFQPHRIFRATVIVCTHLRTERSSIVKFYHCLRNHTQLGHAYFVNWRYFYWLYDLLSYAFTTSFGSPWSFVRYSKYLGWAH